jgi:hypothetical protein
MSSLDRLPEQRRPDAATFQQREESTETLFLESSHHMLGATSD